MRLPSHITCRSETALQKKQRQKEAEEEGNVTVTIAVTAAAAAVLSLVTYSLMNVAHNSDERAEETLRELREQLSKLESAEDI